MPEQNDPAIDPDRLREEIGDAIERVRKTYRNPFQEESADGEKEDGRRTQDK